MQDNNNTKRLNFHADLCLCGSGKLLKDCCLAKRYLTRPKGPKTGYSHPSCYARELQDCSKQLSREHYISRGILRLFGKSDITVSGMPWLSSDEWRDVSDQSSTGKMLCSRHNQALSPLDTVAKNFFEFFVKEWNGEAVEIYLTNGKEIERWLLKTLCGLVVSGNATLNGERLPLWIPPAGWLEVLFGDGSIGNSAGLYYITGNYRAQTNSIHVNPVFKTSTGHPIALAFAVCGIAFLFSLEEPPDVEKPTSSGATIKYRPKVLQLAYREQIREAHFGWPTGPFIGVKVT